MRGCGNLYPEFRAVCLSDSGRLPNDSQDETDWHDWLLHEFAFGSEEQEAMGWHIDYGTKFTRISEMEKFYMKEIAA